MSTSSHSVDANMAGQAIEQIRRQINRLFEEVALLAEQEVKPAQFHAEFLQRVLAGMAAQAGAVWMRTPQGNLQLQYQINMRQAGLESDETIRQRHDELLRQTCISGRPMVVPPHSGIGESAIGQPTAGNPTNYVLLLAPILVDKQTAGLVEVWQDPRHNAESLPGFLQFVVRMATLASIYARNYQLRTMVGQQQIWTSLETFARQVHASLNPTEVSYLVANEGRRLIECDRVSVALRYGRKTVIEAISGADVVEKRSNLVQLERKLVEAVGQWGERLLYSGTKDDTLPPAVLQALDHYLAESASKLLVVLPLKDEREEENKKPTRAAIVIESFEPPAAPDQLLSRLDVVARHSTSALYNAIEHKRIPFRFLWMPLAKVQEGLGGKTRAILYGSAAATVLLLLMLTFLPYPLKMDAQGRLMPEDRRYIYSPVEAQVIDFPTDLQPGKDVRQGQELIRMHDIKLERTLRDLENEVRNAERDIEALGQAYRVAASEAERLRISSEQEQKRATHKAKKIEFDVLAERTNSIADKPGYFWLRAPINGTLLSGEFRENLTNRYVKPSEQLLRIGDKEQAWEIELKIPQKHIGQVLQAYRTDQSDEELEVDVLLLSAPTQVFKGKLARNRIAGEASPPKDETNEPEPVVMAWVRIDGPDIPEAHNLRHYDDGRLLVTGTETHARIRCGNRPMGYSLFYGVWEWLSEKLFIYT